MRYHQSRMHVASLQELSWVPCSWEIHQEQIYRIRDWWGNAVQPVGKRRQNNTDTADVDDFIELLMYSVDNLTTHSLTAKSQAQHLKQRKEEITDKWYHSLGHCWKWSLCRAGWNPGISLEQGPVYHAFCGNISQEGWCTLSHLTVHHFWCL